MRTGSITLRIDSQLENVFLIGAAVNRMLRAIRLDEQAAYEVEVSVVEAVNNAIKHAYGSERGHTVEVVVTVATDRVTFQVCDTGLPMQRMRVELPPVDETNYANLAEGGRGLFIMRSFSDLLAYERFGEKNILTLVKMLPEQAAPARRGGQGVSAASAAVSSSKIRKTR